MQSPLPSDASSGIAASIGSRASRTGPPRSPAHGVPLRARGRARPWLVAVLAMALLAAGAAYLFMRPAGSQDAASAKRGGRPDAGRPTPVLTANVAKGDFDVLIDGLGTVTAANTVAVRSRVDGQLIRVNFKEGQTVKPGELLAEIDPRPFQVALAQAQGQLARDQALLANARVDLERYRGLVAQESAPAQQLDTQAALVRQYEGTIKADQAAVDSARLQLGYTRVIAPAGGRIGLRQVDPGNMIHAADANGIAVITQIQPINVIFPIPQDSLASVVRPLAAGETLSVSAFDRAGRRRIAEGTVVTVDNQIDTSTGTVKVKARFANRDLALFPNQFVNVALRVARLHDVALVPAQAVQRGTPGTFVYRVGPDSKVSVRVIRLGPGNADVAVVEEGLQPGDAVVIDGTDRLKDGSRVEAVKPPAAGGTAAEHRRGKRPQAGDAGAQAGAPGK